MSNKTWKKLVKQEVHNAFLRHRGAAYDASFNPFEASTREYRFFVKNYLHTWQIDQHLRDCCHAYGHEVPPLKSI